MTTDQNEDTDTRSSSAVAESYAALTRGQRHVLRHLARGAIIDDEGPRAILYKNREFVEYVHRNCLKAMVRKELVVRKSPNVWVISERGEQEIQDDVMAA